uniref:Uncharacterized protein n=1 Tax=Ditylenchus dipsaci TaxID=166011 RepID=A0A915DCS8_9BILA
MREPDGAGSSEILISIIKQEPAEREVLSQEEMQNRVGSAEIPMSISQEPVEQELLPVKEVLLESESAKEVIPCAVNDMQKIKKNCHRWMMKSKWNKKFYAALLQQGKQSDHRASCREKRNA